MSQATTNTTQEKLNNIGRKLEDLVTQLFSSVPTPLDVALNVAIIKTNYNYSVRKFSVSSNQEYAPNLSVPWSPRSHGQYFPEPERSIVIVSSGVKDFTVLYNNVTMQNGFGFQSESYHETDIEVAANKIHELLMAAYIQAKSSELRAAYQPYPQHRFQDSDIENKYKQPTPEAVTEPGCKL